MFKKGTARKVTLIADPTVRTGVRELGRGETYMAPNRTRRNRSIQIGTTKVLTPFLALPFDKEMAHELSIFEGWRLTNETLRACRGPLNKAIEISCPPKTPIYAGADGIAFASSLMRYQPDRYDRTTGEIGLIGEPIGDGLGTFVLIWHPNACADGGVYTLYAHLTDIDETNVPYFPAHPKELGWEPRMLHKQVSELLSLVHMTERGGIRPQPIKRGDRIGHAGDPTGLSLYSDNETERQPPNQTKYPTWHPAGTHLRLEMFTGTVMDRVINIDPFGIYGQREAYDQVLVLKQDKGYFLSNDATSKPLYAR